MDEFVVIYHHVSNKTGRSFDFDNQRAVRYAILLDLDCAVRDWNYHRKVEYDNGNDIIECLTPFMVDRGHIEWVRLEQEEDLNTMVIAAVYDIPYRWLTPKERRDIVGLGE